MLAMTRHTVSFQMDEVCPWGLSLFLPVIPKNKKEIMRCHSSHYLFFAVKDSRPHRIESEESFRLLFFQSGEPLFQFFILCFELCLFGFQFPDILKDGEYIVFR